MTKESISDILMLAARDMTRAHMEGKPLDAIKSEYAARISAHYTKGKCRFCGQPAHPDLGNECWRCNYDTKDRPFQIGRDE